MHLGVETKMLKRHSALHSDVVGRVAGCVSCFGLSWLFGLQVKVQRKRRHCANLQKLLDVTAEQVRLYVRGLSAVQEVLRAAPSATLQLSATQQMLHLLTEALEDIQQASTAFNAQRRWSLDVHSLHNIVVQAAGVGSRTERTTQQAQRFFKTFEALAAGPPVLVGGASEEKLQALPAAICCQPPGPCSLTSAHSPEAASFSASSSAAIEEAEVEGSRAVRAPSGRSERQRRSLGGELPQHSLELLHPPGSPNMGPVAEHCSGRSSQSRDSGQPFLPLSGEPCGICLTDFQTGEVARSLDWLHFFHQDCLFGWMRRRASCPTCRMGLRRRRRLVHPEPCPVPCPPSAGASEEELQALPAAICCRPPGPSPTSTHSSEATSPSAPSSAAEVEGSREVLAPSSRSPDQDLPHHSSEPPHPPNSSGLKTDYCPGSSSQARDRDQPPCLLNGGKPGAPAPPSLPLSGEPCGICLTEFQTGEVVRSLDGLHFFHQDCLFQWMRRRASCPTCRMGLRRQQPVQQGEQGEQA